jgi:segregation and condensation protein A
MAAPQISLGSPALPMPQSAGHPVPEEEPFPISLTIGEIYEGPLDLLLALIRKQNIDIYDIPIALITKQFQQYVKGIRVQDIDVAGEFFLMSSQLIQIKSKMLLPGNPSAADQVPADDPRRDLVAQLIEHERFKQAAQMLQNQLTLSEATWSRPGMQDWRKEQGEQVDVLPPVKEADPITLASVFSDILERAANRPHIDTEEDSLTVEEMINFLGRRIVLANSPQTLQEILGRNPSTAAITTAFLAMLEMARLGAIILRQDTDFGSICVKATPNLDSVLRNAADIQLGWT